MTFLEILLLAVALAMDCFAVSIAAGVMMRKMQWNTMLRMTFLFGLFQAGMPFAGWLGSCFFCEQLMSVGSWVAFALLSLIGGKMIKDSFGDDEEEAHFNPRKLHTQFLLAVATSIDALAVGVSLVCLGYTRVPMLALPLWCIGLMSFALGLLGCALGVHFGHSIAKRLKPERFGGIVLIIIGLKILLF